MSPDGILAKYLSRHYHLVLLVIGIGTMALFRHLVSGTEWATVATCAIGTFRVGDAVDTWIHAKKVPDKE
jgi:hypothetical protein